MRWPPGARAPSLRAPLVVLPKLTMCDSGALLGAEVEKRPVEDHAEAGEEEKRREDLVDKGWNGNGKSHAAVPGGEEIDNAGEKRVEKTAAHVFAAFESVNAIDALGDSIGGGNGFAAIGAARQRYTNRLSTKWATTRRKQMSLVGV